MTNISDFQQVAAEAEREAAAAAAVAAEAQARVDAARAAIYEEQQRRRMSWAEEQLANYREEFNRLEEAAALARRHFDKEVSKGPVAAHAAWVAFCRAVAERVALHERYVTAAGWQGRSTGGANFPQVPTGFTALYESAMSRMASNLAEDARDGVHAEIQALE